MTQCNLLITAGTVSEYSAGESEPFGIFTVLLRRIIGREAFELLLAVSCDGNFNIFSCSLLIIRKINLACYIDEGSVIRSISLTDVLATHL